MKHLYLVLIGFFLIAPPLTQAGKLSDFEESATSNGDDNKASGSHHDDEFGVSFRY